MAAVTAPRSIAAGIGAAISRLPALRGRDLVLVARRVDRVADLSGGIPSVESGGNQRLSSPTWDARWVLPSSVF